MRRVKASRFNFRTNYERTGEVLLFNTLTGAFCAVDSQTVSRIDRLLENPRCADEDPELGTFLLTRGFLVDEGVDENAIVVERSRLGIDDPNRIDIIVMPNMNCNFACTYCYEAHEKSEMSEATAARLMSWVDKTLPRFKAVLLSWFGGEPLLSFNKIVEIQRHVREVCSRNNLRFSSHITTNGYLLSPDRAAELISLDCYSYQITLDGPPETHDAKRPLRGGGSTFGRIMNNICDFARTHESANIKLRVNYDEASIDRIAKLLDRFPRDVRHRLDIVYERIFGQEYSKYADAMPGRRAGTAVERLYDYAERAGFSVTMNTLEPARLSYCYADRKSEFVFNYNGDVFKCTVDKFQPRDRLGMLGSDGVIVWEGDRLTKWHAVDTFEDKCYACTFMPMCMGGCRKLRWREQTVGENCKLPFMGFDKRLQLRYARQRGDEPIVSNFQSPTRPNAAFHILD